MKELKMFFLNFFSGTIIGKSKFLSTDSIRDSLSGRYRLSVIHQSSDIFRCKLLIPNYFLGSFRELGPHPRITIKIIRGSNCSNISYEFFWPEYLVAFVFSILIGIAVFSNTHDLLVVVILYLLFLILFLCIFYLQTKAHSICIRMLLEKS